MVFNHLQVGFHNPNLVEYTKWFTGPIIAAVLATKHSSGDSIRRVIDTLSVENLRENLEGLTAFDNRYYHSTSGRESQKWLFERICNVTAQSVSHTTSSHVSVQEFDHPWLQNSIIAQIKGKTDELVIIGAHLDSISDPEGPAPGADDDGSGVVSALEAYRALISYAAEEVGWLGSRDVVKAYTRRGARARGMLQFDMTAWVKDGTREEIGILGNCADEGLRPNILLTIAAMRSRLSDNRCARRSAISPEFSFSHTLEFSKLAVAFAIELGEV
ncbi:Zn-dependent exopeptidase [Sistotremastrum niveocremeum HHB9708]|uniref:Peptide hydrolase n=1 Tax=Sistotremastrum niveocremeum HHB9708 TaxID=1314777 RepID=A0A164MSL2_9AGAM|nr:Zn-dependent exopeptidase [Sistotremastrum niveocremeum HHB9708]